MSSQSKSTLSNEKRLWAEEANVENKYSGEQAEASAVSAVYWKKMYFEMSQKCGKLQSILTLKDAEIDKLRNALGLPPQFKFGYGSPISQGNMQWRDVKEEDIGDDIQSMHCSSDEENNDDDDDDGVDDEDNDSVDYSEDDGDELMSTQRDPICS